MASSATTNATKSFFPISETSPRMTRRRFD
jgi:hypothetical protein